MTRPALALLTAALLGAPAAADETPPCPPGYRLVEETTYRECTRQVCRVVPDVKKARKTVYACRAEPYCLPHCEGPLRGWLRRLFTGDGACCGECRGPYHKTILRKKEVVEECPTTKCVVETVIDRIPCKTYRVVPVEPAPPR